MKSLKEQVSEIKSMKASMTAKREMFVKLGLQKYEVSLLMNELKNERQSQVIEQRFKITFGVEIECLAARDAIVRCARENEMPINYEGYNHIDNRSYFKFVSDASIQGENPIECVSPILTGTKGMRDLEKCCKVLNDAGAKVNRSTGLHVHIGAQNMTHEHYINIFKNYQMIEQAIDSFMAYSRRLNNNGFCKSLINFDFSHCQIRRDVLDEMHCNRYYKVNALAYERHHTVEFRQHQGSTDFDKISAWVNFLAKLVAYSKSHVIDSTIGNIEDIPFLTKKEKEFFIRRREALA